MVDRKTYLEQQIAARLRYWIGAMLFLGILFFPFIGIADYFVTPENFGRFAGFRLVITAVLLVFFLLNRRKGSTRYHYALIAGATVLAAIPIEAMVLSFGGHASTYYAGFSLLIIAAIGLIPYGFRLSLSMGIVVYLIYLVPILVLDTITDVPAFIANNIFLACTFVIALVWRTLTQRSMINELNLQYDLLAEKNELQLHAEQLERAMADLNRSEQRHESLFENATDGIMVLDRTGIIVNANQRACEMHGFSRESLVGAHIRMLETDDNRTQMTERMRRILDGEALVFETVHHRKDGSRFDLEISSKAITIGGEVFIQSFSRDITERKKVREHLFQSQKLESIGVLAGGIAHDFNNILAAILGYTEVIRRNSGENEKVIRSVNVIESAIRKSGTMISQLLDFSRKKSREFAPFSMNDVVQDTIRLLERVIGSGIVFTEVLESSLPPIRGDVNQMEQVLMNLIVNARDAMPNGGRIIISTSVLDARRNAAGIPPYLPENRYVLMTVADTGAGIPPEVKDKIFEPFFTTKARGKGTGLGLSMVYGVVREHNGYITVQSTVGVGTTFSLFLPAPAQTAPAEPLRTPAALEGKETILVVDDDRGTLNRIRESLELYGYRVMTAGDPLHALELFRREHQRIDLVITDIALSTMSGAELIRAMQAIKPAARVLEISTYAAAGEETEQGGSGVLFRKPFEAYSLALSVRKILDGSPGSIKDN